MCGAGTTRAALSLFVGVEVARIELGHTRIARVSNSDVIPLRRQELHNILHKIRGIDESIHFGQESSTGATVLLVVIASDDIGDGSGTVFADHAAFERDGVEHGDGLGVQEGIGCIVVVADVIND